MLMYIGILIFLAVSVQLPWIFLRKVNDPIRKAQFQSAEYVTASLILYFCGKPVFYSLVEHQNITSLRTLVGLAFILAAVCLIGEYQVLTRTADVFKRLLVGTSIMLATSISIMSVVGPGIVNIVWSIVLPGAMCGYFLAIEFTGAVKLLLQQLPQIANREARQELLEASKREADRLLKLAAQSFFALAASIGVSMSILFKSGSEAWTRLDYQATAAQMVLGLLLITLGLLFSFAKPYLGIVANVNEAQISIYRESATDVGNEVV